jgi:TPR repeat protein
LSFLQSPQTFSQRIYENAGKRMNFIVSNAIYNLGMTYFNGEDDSDTKKDPDKAIKLLHHAAELGSAQAYWNLGVLYFTGDGVSKDKAKSAMYHDLAAMAGDVTARTQLGCNDANVGNFNRAIKHIG